MANILISYYSRTGNTKKMAELIAEGATAAGGEVTLKGIEEILKEDLVKADAIIIGSPTFYGHCAAPVRQFFDESVRLHGRLQGKVGGAFASSHNIGGGNETTILGILESMLIHGMIIPGSVDGDHYGPVAIGAPDARATSQCRAHGDRIAKLAERLKKS